METEELELETPEKTAEETTSPPPEVEEGAEEQTQETKEGDDATQAETKEELSERIEKRIAQLNARIGAEGRKAERLRQENEELRKAKETPEITERPRRDDFETDEQYEDAYFDYRSQREAKTRQDEATRQVNAEAQRTYEKRIDEGLEKYAELGREDEFNTAIYKMEMSPNLIIAVQEGEMPVEVAMHLYENPDVLAKLQPLSERAAIRAIAKLETELTGTSKGDKPTKKTKTDAPSATETVGSGTPPKKRELNELNAEEFADRRNKEDQARADRGE